MTRSNTASDKNRAFRSLVHNHGACLASAIERAEALFAARGLTLTKLRRQVFEEVASSHDAVGAYDVLERLSQRTGKRVAPISVYRAIDALLAAGAVHRLETRNAFFACHAGHEPGREQLVLACDECGRVAEVPGEVVFSAMTRLVRDAHFVPRRTVVEVNGTCADCRQAA